MRVLYDTCVFLLAQNQSDADYKRCCSITDPAEIKWSVSFSSISRGEATIDELLDQFVTQCALYGVDLSEVSSEEIKEAQRALGTRRRTLAQLGMQTRDIKQVAASIASESDHLLTRDADFLSPKNKRSRGQRRPATDVVKLLADDFKITVVTPSSFQKMHGPRQLG